MTTHVKHISAVHGCDESCLRFFPVNALNQYTGINTENTEDAEEANNSVGSVSSVFNPSYDEDGNATLIQTSTGTWQISYNAENRPIRFENAATQTVVECIYDSQGRRFEKKVTETHKELKSQIRRIVENRGDKTIGFHEKAWQNINLASLNGGVLYLQKDGLVDVVNVSSKVMASGKYSFCRVQDGGIRQLQGEISISWYDEMDANGWLEFYNKEIKGNENWTVLIPQWILEGFVDLIGDGALDANFKFVIESKVCLNYEF